ncbi:hypothetical protein ACS0TY_034288 [Phlomoides rotata]
MYAREFHEPEKPVHRDVDNVFRASRVPSVIVVNELEHFQRIYEIPLDVHIWAPTDNERAAQPPECYVAVYEDIMKSGFYFPLHPTISKLLASWNLTITQLTPNSWHIFISLLTLFDLEEYGHYLNTDEVAYILLSRANDKGKGLYYLKARPKMKTVKGVTKKIKDWKEKFFFVGGPLVYNAKKHPRVITSEFLDKFTHVAPEPVSSDSCTPEQRWVSQTSKLGTTPHHLRALNPAATPAVTGVAAPPIIPSDDEDSSGDHDNMSLKNSPTNIHSDRAERNKIEDHLNRIGNVQDLVLEISRAHRFLAPHIPRVIEDAARALTTGLEAAVKRQSLFDNIQLATLETSQTTVTLEHVLEQAGEALRSAELFEKDKLALGKKLKTAWLNLGKTESKLIATERQAFSDHTEAVKGKKRLSVYAKKCPSYKGL